MEKISKGVLGLIGKTPLVELTKLEREENLKARIVAKLECNNPAGSAKDRVAKYMLLDAKERGLIKDGAVIIEPTSGNTGIGLASVGAALGYKVILTMPDTMSVERRNLLKAFGATIELTDGKLGMKGAIDRANELHAKIEGSFIPSQFDNKVNAKAHYETTGPEIYEDTNGEVDILVATVGTGGTVTGTGEYLKSKKSDVKVVAVEPKSSPLLTKGYAGSHKIQGIGANFIPSILNISILDEVMDISDEAAYEMGRRVSRSEGILTGISGGAGLSAAVELAKREENAGKMIVVILTDSGERYLSTEGYLI